MWCIPGLYRVRLLRDFAETIVLPSIMLSVVLSLLRFQLGLFAVPLHFAFIFAWATTRGALTEFKQIREARLLGARPIPQVVGKWPGNLDILLRMIIAFRTSYILDVYLQLFEQYQSTTLNLRILWHDSIISMDQEHSKFVLTTGFQLFWRGIAQKERMELLLGSGIFNRDDQTWKIHRNVARPFFAKDRFSDFEVVERHCTRTLSIIASHGDPLDAQDLLGRFILDSASEFLFGKNLDTLSGTLPVAGEAKMGPKGSLAEGNWGTFAEAFEMAQVNITNRGRLGSIWPLFELFKDKNEEHCQVIRQWLGPLVQHALDERVKMEKTGISKCTAERNFLEHLVENAKGDPVSITDQLVNMLLASRDTTTATLTFMTYFMALNPDVTKRLREEVLEQCGPSGTLTLEKIKCMKYMRAVINETLRLFPAVPMNVRESREMGCVLPKSDATYPESEKLPPLYMPAQTTFLFSSLLTQRNRSLWGDDADEFDPDRWIDPKRSAKIGANPAMFTPFSTGPRQCIGQDYAYNQMSYFLVRLLQQYDRFTLAPEVQPTGSLPPEIWKSRKGRQMFERIWPDAAMTLYVKGGLWVRFHRAEHYCR